jgi:hypothetical protein
MRKLQIGVIGSAGPEEYPRQGRPENEIFQIARRLGGLVAENNAVLITGGKGGIMEAASRGAKAAGGTTVGIVKGKDRFTSNPFTDVEIVSGMEGCGEESMLVLSCDGLIGAGGGAGTLQELTIAYRNRKPVVLINSRPGWAKALAGKYLDGRKIVRFKTAATPQKAVKMLLRLISSDK